MHLITRYLNGGAETTTDNAIKALHEADEEYELHLGTGEAHDQDRLADAESKGVKTVVFHRLRHYNPIAALIAVLTIAWYLHRNDIDVLHTHSTEAGIVGRWAAFLARTPFVVHEIHGDPISEDHHPLLNAFVLAAERVSARTTDLLIVKSKRIREEFIDRGIGEPEQYELIYHGVDIDAFADSQPAILPESNADHRLLFVGRLAEGKGLYDLLDAFKSLRQEISVELIIAGDGPIAEEFTTRVEESELSDAVRLLGYRSDVPNLLAASDVFVLPSYREGTPRVISEALASGTPVVSTRIAGIPEQVADGETGLLYDPGDVEELKNAISELLEDDELRVAMTDRCRKSVERFRCEHSARQVQELYKKHCFDQSSIDSPIS
ncbi:glycosyltransferase [Halobaculum sp. WSA2]|uniref:Glycosyltransferase n=1 Tax=Halobaculum saliterrae TaxID=2073113 RepID=A0A6B0SZ82_9EURY|nr:glycosyltransferase family 4 protein [Halobaculum saliterrae]MXR41851.1 glycosyltransferase [Halobaculum saliterrae]